MDRLVPGRSGPNRQAVVHAYAISNPQHLVIGEQQQLERFGHWAEFRRVGMIHREVYHIGPIRSGTMGRRAGKLWVAVRCRWLACYTEFRLPAMRGSRMCSEAEPSGCFSVISL